jgi:hypothetical protein
VQKLDDFYAQQEEPLKSCLQALRIVILNYSKHVSERWYYRLPCFFYNGKIFCYLWFDRKTQQPYIALYPGRRLTHKVLISGNRTQSKILMIDPQKDLPMKTIREIFKQAIALQGK